MKFSKNIAFYQHFVFWIFLPNVSKIDAYNFEKYRFKIGAFLRHSVVWGQDIVNYRLHGSAALLQRWPAKSMGKRGFWPL